MLSLPFNPIKLVCLVAWVYCCLYSAYRLQSSPLLPRRRKLLTLLVALVAGPLVFLVLAFQDARRSSKSGGSLVETLLRRAKDAIASIRPGRLRSRQGEAAIMLLDSSGTDLKKIWGHGSSKRDDNRAPEMTAQIIADALQQRASDILIDPKDESLYTLRFRVDGVLRMVQQLQGDECRAIVNSIKAVASMDISERRRPQDGAFMARMGAATAHFRVASAGALYGEKLSIRVLNQGASGFSLADVGLADKQSSIIKEALNKPSGMVLICGPTGSGKTTTLYAMLNQLDPYTHNVITVEDPIEAVLPEVSQIEINPRADITFAKALRSILRQDPDVICVGEIRDEETAEIALRASQTGHLVLATIHCGSNAAAMVRLLDLGVSPILLSSGLSLLVSQRLLRRLCDHCKTPIQLSGEQVRRFRSRGIDCTGAYKAAGCERCGGTGYFGRTAVGDLLVVTNRVKLDIINNQALIAELKAEDSETVKASFVTKGLEKVAAGVTSLEELTRVIG